jgi:hypothetical protein
MRVRCSTFSFTGDGSAIPDREQVMDRAIFYLVIVIARPVRRAFSRLYHRVYVEIYWRKSS